MEHQSHHIPFSSPLLLLALQLGIIAKAAAVAATAIIRVFSLCQLEPANGNPAVHISISSVTQPHILQP